MNEPDYQELRQQRDALYRGAEKLFERLPEAAMIAAGLRIAMIKTEPKPEVKK